MIFNACEYIKLQSSMLWYSKAPSLWHVSATRADFEAAPQLGSPAASFSG